MWPNEFIVTYIVLKKLIVYIIYRVYQVSFIIKFFIKRFACIYFFLILYKKKSVSMFR